MITLIKGLLGGSLKLRAFWKSSGSINWGCFPCTTEGDGAIFQRCPKTNFFARIARCRTILTLESGSCWGFAREVMRSRNSPFVLDLTNECATCQTTRNTKLPSMRTWYKEFAQVDDDVWYLISFLTRVIALALVTSVNIPCSHRLYAFPSECLTTLSPYRTQQMWTLHCLTEQPFVLSFISVRLNEAMRQPSKSSEGGVYMYWADSSRPICDSRAAAVLSMRRRIILLN